MYMRNGYDTSGSIDFISRVRFFMLIAYVQYFSFFAGISLVSLLQRMSEAESSSE